MAITISGQNNNDKILASDGVLDSISGFNVVGVMTAAQFDVTGKTTTNHLNIGSNIQIGNAGIITATTLIGNVTGNINASSTLLLQTGGSERFRIASAGQLGIGGANYGSAGQVLTSGGSGSAATWSTIASDKIIEGNTEAEVVDTGSDGHFKVTTEGSERLRVSADGNVTVGAAVTISPVGNINATGIITARSGINISSGSLTIPDSIIHSGDTNTKIRFPAADTISFETAGSEVLSMNLDGLVTGGQTNPTSSDNGNIYIKNGSAIGAVSHQLNYVTNAVFNGAWKYITSSVGATRIIVNQNGYQFDAAASGTAGNNITFTPLLNISNGGAHKITCNQSHFSANLSEMNTGNLALNIIQTRSGQTKGIGFGAIGSSNSNTGIQAYDTSNNSANPLLLNPFGGNVGINETSPDSLLHLTTNSSTTYSTSEVNTVNSTNALLRLENTNGGDGSGVNNYVGMYFRVANGANSDAQLQYVRTGDNAGAFHFKARNAGSTYPNLMTMKSDGNTGFDGVVDPKSPVHLGSNTEMRIGGQYGGLSPIMMQVQYAAGYTGTHWMFETNQMISWSFDGVLIVYGGGGSSYGSEVTKITIVYSRESGANNSGDIWRNGTTSYNIETLGHGQVGLNPSAGELTVTEDTAPDGAGSTRSLFKLGWTTAGHGGATTIWSKLHGTMYWGTGSSGDVEIQDKDGNIFWDSNP